MPIVFLHGVGSDKSVWRPQLDHFGDERRAIAFDYPGYGDSDPAPEGTTRDDYAAAILSAMAALGIDRAHVCGLSLGGVVAIAIYHAAPDALRLADPRRHLRRPSRRPGDLRPLDRGERRTCARSPRRASTCCSPSPPTRGAQRSRRDDGADRPRRLSHRRRGRVARRPERARRRHPRADAGRVRDRGPDHPAGAVDGADAHDPWRPSTS